MRSSSTTNVGLPTAKTTKVSSNPFSDDDSDTTKVATSIHAASAAAASGGGGSGGGVAAAAATGGSDGAGGGCGTKAYDRCQREFHDFLSSPKALVTTSNVSSIDLSTKIKIFFGNG